MSARIRFLIELNDEELRELLGADPMTALVGSGVSIWNPTNLPSGAAFGMSVFRALFHDDSGRLDDPLDDEVEALFSKVPFENVMERCPEPAILTSWLRQTYDVTSYNVIHKEFARALINGRLHAIITTNYDCCLDQALSEIKDHTASPLTRSTATIIWEDEVPPAGKDKGYYFKIHGSADDLTGESLTDVTQREAADVT